MSKTKKIMLTLVGLFACGLGATLVGCSSKPNDTTESTNNGNNSSNGSTPTNPGNTDDKDDNKGDSSEGNDDKNDTNPSKPDGSGDESSSGDGNNNGSSDGNKPSSGDGNDNDSGVDVNPPSSSFVVLSDSFLNGLNDKLNQLSNVDSKEKIDSLISELRSYINNDSNINHSMINLQYTLSDNAKVRNNNFKYLNISIDFNKTIKMENSNLIRIGDVNINDTNLSINNIPTKIMIDTPVVSENWQTPEPVDQGSGKSVYDISNLTPRFINGLSYNGHNLNFDEYQKYLYANDSQSFNISLPTTQLDSFSITLPTNYDWRDYNGGYQYSDNAKVKIKLYGYQSSIDKFNLDSNTNTLSLKHPITLSVNEPLMFGVQTIVSEEGYQTKHINVTFSLYSSNVNIHSFKEGDDYFVKPGTLEVNRNDPKNWIVNPYTTNQTLIREYGNFPLPFVSDKDITMSDIEYGFYYLYTHGITKPLTLGNRMIDSDTWNNSYADFLVKYWKYIPYITSENPTLVFYTNTITPLPFLKMKELAVEGKIDDFIKNNKFYIKGISGLNLLENVEQPTYDRDMFLKGIRMFLDGYVYDGMSDLDKIWTVYAFIENWTRYDGKSANLAQNFWNNHTAVCNEYATMMAFFLNLVGIPAMPVAVAMNGNEYKPTTNQGHMITWIWGDFANTGKKQWYMSDPTFGIFGGTAISSIRYSFGNMHPLKNVLRAVNKSRWADDWAHWNKDHTEIDINVSDLQVSNLYQLYASPWYSQNINDYISYNGYNLVNKSGFLNYFNTTNNQNSKFIYLDGYWYSLVKDNSDIKLLKSKMDDSNPPVDVFSTLPEEVRNILTSQKYSSIGANQYRNIVFLSIGQDEIYNYGNTNKPEDRTIIAFDTSNNTWNNYKVFKLKNETLDVVQDHVDYASGKLVPNYRIDSYNSNLVTYYVDENGQFLIRYKNEYRTKTDNDGNSYKTIVRDVKDDEITKWVKEHTTLTKSSLRNEQAYLSIDYNSHFIGTSDFEISTKDWMNFNKEIWNVNLENNYQEDLNKLHEIYNKYNSKLIKSNGEYLEGRPLGDIYSTSLDNFNNYGLTFNVNDGYQNLDYLVTDVTTKLYRYNIYFSKTLNGDFKQVGNDLYKPVLTKDMLSKFDYDPTGYIYLEIYPSNNPTKITKTNIAQIITNKDAIDYGRFNKLKITYQDSFVTTSMLPTNYTLADNQWYDRSISLNVGPSAPLNLSHYDQSVEINFYSYKTHQLSTVASGSWQPYTNLSLSYNLGIPNEDNKGIYFVTTTIKDKSTNITYKTYSEFCYIITNNDLLNEKTYLPEWIKLSHELYNKLNQTRITINKLNQTRITI